MLRWKLWLPVLALVLPPGAARAQEKQAPDSPARKEYQELLREYQKGSSGRVLTDADRLQFVGKVYRDRNRLALKFLELAEKYPLDPMALDALLQAIWQVNTTPWPVELVGPDEACARAFAILERDFIRSDRLAPTCQRVSYGFRREYELFLRAVLEKNPHREVRGAACLALAHFLGNRLLRIEAVRGQPDASRELEDLFGKEYIESLKRQDRERAGREVEALLDQALQTFAEVRWPDEGTVGEKAAADLFEVRHLSVGKEAPDIEGEDQDGKKFRLGEYRGKVVLLDFWQEF